MAALAEEQTEVAVKLEPEGPPTLLPPQAGDGAGEGGGGTTNNGPNGGGGNVAAASSSAGGDGGTPKPSVAVSAVAPAGAATVPAAAPEAGAPHDRQTLLAVLQFLRQSNLREAEEALRREARLLEEAVAGTGVPGEADGAGAEAASALLSRVTASAPGPAATDPPGTGASGAAAVSGLATGPAAPGKVGSVAVEDQPDVSAVLSAYNQQGDPTMYEEYYSGLKHFIECSLDCHRAELSQLFYPLFVHMYLELVYNQHENEAKSFFEKGRAVQDWHGVLDYQGLRLSRSHCSTILVMQLPPVAQDGSLVLSNHISVTVSREGTHPSWKLHTLSFYVISQRPHLPTRESNGVAISSREKLEYHRGLCLLVMDGLNPCPDTMLR
ncbi:TAF5-like RNA polymerase II p300/CBP-associated factor-associated factor 65 kDa subunit 5L isoform X1 [Prionailurus iriomotensis]